MKMWYKMELILARLENYLFFNPIMKKTKQKKCKDCVYAYRKGHIFACNKSEYYIEPLKLICFKRSFKRRKDNGRTSEGN